MTTGKIAAFARADRALAGAVFFAFVSAAGFFAANLYTDEFVSVAEARSLQPSPVQLEKEIADRKAARERQCLAQVLYYEARGEGQSGEMAVAEVVMARVQSRYYPRTICGVVLEGADRPGKHCQFSFACDGSLQRPKDAMAWERARGLADKILAGAIKLGGQTGHATAYHSASVSPDWADEMQRTAQIGNHIFYRRMPLNARLTVQMMREIPIAPAPVADGELSATAEIRLDEVKPDIEIAGAVGDGA